MLKIVKLENGVVTILGGSVYPNRSFSSFARVNYKKDGTFEIDELGKIVCSFKGSDVVSTQVLPAAAVDYTDDNTLLAILQTDFFFDVSGGGGTADSILLAATGIFDLGTSFITPAALTVSTNDYTEAGGDDVMVWRISATGAVNLTGVAAPPAGTSPLRILRNVGANTITLQKQSVLSVAANRFDFPPATIALQGGGWRWMFYDQASQLLLN